MAYDFSKLKQKTKEIEEWLKRECQGIRTGRATPTLLDGVMVEAYGSRMALNQVASITTEDPRTLRVAPWDTTQIKAIEKAITVANLGVSAGSDERGVRVFFPELTSERRTSLVKILRERLEDARKSLRAERDEVWSDIQQKERDGDMGEDEKFRLKDEMQKIIDAGSKALEEVAERKEGEIMN